MQIYFAPMEGITGFVCRNAYEACFPGSIRKYFAPFITASSRKALSNKEIRDLSPENNTGIHLVPQLLANDVDAFVQTAERICAYGYDEINLNLGCPSKTVVTKKKGAGLLAYPKLLEEFLDGIYTYGEKNGNCISIKTRIGMYEPEEWDRLLALYEKFPVSELIVHPRLQTEYYEGKPHTECFERALSKSCCPVIYNGDLFDKNALTQFAADFPQQETVMIGRGFLMHPGFSDRQMLWRFHDAVYAGYCEQMQGDTNVLFKMKELLSYLQVGIMENRVCEGNAGGLSGEADQGNRQIAKQLKEIRKCKTKREYERAIRMLRQF